MENEEDAEADHENPSLSRGFCLDPFPSLTLYSRYKGLTKGKNKDIRK